MLSKLWFISLSVPLLGDLTSATPACSSSPGSAIYRIKGLHEPGRASTPGGTSSPSIGPPSPPRCHVRLRWPRASGAVPPAQPAAARPAGSPSHAARRERPTRFPGELRPRGSAASELSGTPFQLGSGRSWSPGLRSGPHPAQVTGRAETWTSGLTERAGAAPYFIWGKLRPRAE
jgi:hypothetical protein